MDGEQADAQYTDRIVLSIIVPQEQSQKFKSTNFIENVQCDRHAAANGHVNRPVAILKSNDDEWNIEQNIT